MLRTLARVFSIQSFSNAIISDRPISAPLRAPGHPRSGSVTLRILKSFISSVVTPRFFAAPVFAAFAFALPFFGIQLGAAAEAADVNGAGASFPYPIYSAWAYGYEQATGSKVNYQSIGSGGGIKQVTEGTVDFGASDDPMSTEDLQKAGLIQFPAVLGGVVTVINLDGFANNELVLNGQLLADIFQGKILKWNDPAIAALNSGKALPDADINVVYRSDSSGTSAIFTNYLSAVSPGWKEAVGAGKSVNWPVGVGAKGNDGVAGSVKRVKNSIGYVEYAYAAENKITWAALVNKAGKTVAPSIESFTAAAGNAKWDKGKAYFIWLVDAEGDASWPIAAATFILVKTADAQVLQNVTDFFEWCFQNGDPEAVRLQYVPLPADLKDDVRGYWKEAGRK
ncbi:MAG: phosphate ABC transporter substrate-binding protein PstS [Deltaproteobacteria bacterium]|jgi:phosphate transport system substrate-binding protein|nr:phosphate ABC transporter substrate-binding protein PstS [Deltaproteobacteria bacterium]